MASRQSDSMALVAKAKAAGWAVKRGSDGWRITTPDGVFVVHLTYSDVRSLRNAESELDRRGLAAALAAQEAAAEARRQAALAEDRKRNDLEMARKAALARAAGPYAPSTVTLDEILRPHPAPTTYHQVEITPAMAAALLERNSTNRSIRRADVEDWCRVLRGGRWAYTHQGVAVNTSGELQDGQHRLTAIAETGIPAVMMVSCGMPPDNFSKIDTGRRRTNAQAIEIAGATHAATAASAMRVLYTYERWGAELLDRYRNERVDADLQVKMWHQLNHERLGQAIKDAYRVRTGTGQPPSGVAAAMYLIYEACGEQHRGLVPAFVNALATGVGQGPAVALHRRLIHSRLHKQRVDPAVACVFVMKAWNWEGRRSVTPRSFPIREGLLAPTTLLIPGAAAVAGEEDL